MSFHVPEQYRVKHGEFGTSSAEGNNGLFFIPASAARKTAALKVIASDGLGWEHASVSLRGEMRCPTWEEMCIVKNLFWDEDDAVMQLHPPRADYVNNHRACLHLWRPNAYGVEIPLPDSLLVGFKGLRLI